MTSAVTDIAMFDGSMPALVVAALIDQFGLEGAHGEIDRLLDQCDNVELEAHDHDWANVWARPKQHAPLGDWQSWGYLAGRGNGKTKGISHWINDEVEAGRAPLICLIAQDEDSSIKLHVTGPSGLLATAKPWFKPEWHASDLELVWPNGAKAYVRTPEVPRKIRGLEYHLAWMSEIQSWPTVTREEAYMNVLISTRLGLARIVWDATAARRHPLLKKLITNAEVDPAHHVLVAGSTYENVLNLGRGYIEKIEAAYGGTQQGEEELFGKMFDDSEGATAKAAWILRRPAPKHFVRRVIGLDVAVTNRAGNDSTGIVEDGLGVDGHCYVLKDRSGKYGPDEWAKILLDMYVEDSCDCIVVETNKGGDLVVQVLRAAARERDLTVIVLAKEERPRCVQGVVYVREVYARGEKADRARPVGTAYERGRISHVGEFVELENIITTWVPSPGERSPDRLDAHVHAVTEILDLTLNKIDPKKAFEGISQLAAAIAGPTATATRRNIPSLLGGRGGDDGGRI